jgi:hypothetical protein
MSLTKKQELERVKKQNRRLLKMIAEERQKVAGYEQVAQVNSAYISILLKRLGATEDNRVDIQASEVTEAMAKYEARALATENGFGLYYAEPMEVEKVQEE